MEGHHHRLKDVSTEHADIAGAASLAEAACGPVDGVGLGESPFERAVGVVDLLHEGRFQLVPFDEVLDACDCLRGLGVEEGIVVRVSAADGFVHGLGPVCLVREVGVVEVRAHLVVEVAGELGMDVDGVGIVLQAFVAEEFDAALDPEPAILGVGELDRDVVGKVPG